MTEAAMEINWTVIIAAMSLEVVLISSAIGVVWKLSRSELAQRAETDAKIAAVKVEADKATAFLSDKLYQVEIWARDEFIRKGSFDLIVGKLEKSVEKIGEKIDAKFDELTKRIDKSAR